MQYENIKLQKTVQYLYGHKFDLDYNITARFNWIEVK